jgi:hypothetical protein
MIKVAPGDILILTRFQPGGRGAIWTQGKPLKRLNGIVWTCPNHPVETGCE